MSGIQKSDPSNTLEFDYRFGRLDECNEYFLTECSTTVKLNENYESELLKYNTEKQKYEYDLVKYNKLCEQAHIERISHEKELRRKKYEELRKEFESN